MTKSILMYVSPKEALNVLKQAVRDNWDDEAVTDDLEPEFTCLEGRLLLAEKEHELLELYREYHIVQENSEFYKRLYTSLLESNRDYHDDYLSYKRCEEDKDKLIERIMKLEEELKVKE